MALLVPVATSDNVPQLIVKLNLAINALNAVLSQGTISDNGIFTITQPLNNQDIMVYDSTTDVFTNTGIAALTNAILIQIEAANSTICQTMFQQSFAQAALN